MSLSATLLRNTAAEATSGSSRKGLTQVDKASSAQAVFPPCHAGDFVLQFAAVGRTGDLSEKETVERLFRLADVHKQIMASKSNTLDLKSFSTLFSQLMLPLLGLLLGNLDTLSKLLR